MKYSQFIHNLKQNGIDLDRKTLATIAYEYPEQFDALIEIGQKKTPRGKAKDAGKAE
jgi:ribosomal protein L20